MTILQAPFSSIQTTIRLPSPNFGDTLGLGLDMDVMNSINNNRYTYIKRKGRDKINCTIEMTKKKALELQAFINLYLMDEIRLTDYKGDVWNVKLTQNPFDYEYVKRGEITTIQLVFEGVKIHAATINC